MTTNEKPVITGRHREAIDELVRLHGDDPNKVALVICGSLATGKAREGSDADIYLVVTDDEFEQTRAMEGCFYGSWDPNEFSGIEIDGKIVGKRFLEEAAVRGSEPTRASFEGAYTEFTTDPEIGELIKRISAYPEWERDAKTKTFYAFAKHYRYVGEQGFLLGNDYLARRCVMELVFFAARLVLAHNRVLFPCHKSLFAALERCEDLPSRFVERSRRLLENPSLPETIDYHEKVSNYFSEYDFPDQERISFILENEWSWFSGMPFAGDL
ncbi:MAG: nucleotidyltransferase domain-containing protein [Gaiellaceae bacterium]